MALYSSSTFGFVSVVFALLILVFTDFIFLSNWLIYHSSRVGFSPSLCFVNLARSTFSFSTSGKLLYSSFLEAFDILFILFSTSEVYWLNSVTFFSNKLLALSALPKLYPALPVTKGDGALIICLPFSLKNCSVFLLYSVKIFLTSIGNNSPNFVIARFFTLFKIFWYSAL